MDFNDKSWFTRSAESLRRERKEAEARYGVKIGQTDIYCARCGTRWGYGGHICVKRDESRKKPRQNAEFKRTEAFPQPILAQSHVRAKQT